MNHSPSITVDDYLSSFPADVRERLSTLRELIQKIAPQAKESISYAIPTYKLNGKPLVYFAGFKNHIGLYALPTGHAAFAEEFKKYKTGKGSVQFPLNQEFPLELISKVVEFRVKEVLKLFPKEKK